MFSAHSSAAVRSALLIAAGAALSEAVRVVLRHARRWWPRPRPKFDALSLRVRSLPPSTLYEGRHALAPLMKRPGMAVLSGGVPPAVTFPLRGLTFSAALPSAPAGLRHLSGGDSGGGGTIELSLSEAEVALAQRYAPFAWESLRAWVDAHVRALHGPMPDHRVCLTAGSMSGVEMVMGMLVDRGDTVLVEERTFMAALDVFASLGAVTVPVAMDARGIVPGALQ